MKVLILTSKSAYKKVLEEAEELSKNTRWKVEVLALKVPVALLLTVNKLSKLLREYKRELVKYDLIVVPGGIKGDLRVLEELFNVKFVKGPSQASDISFYLSRISIDKLSTVKPAEEVALELRDTLLSRAFNEICRRVEESTYLEVGSLKVPTRPPPILVVGEIVDCYSKSLNEILEIVEYISGMGASIVSLGFGSSNPNPDLVGSTVKKVKEEVGTPVAVDTMVPSEINSAIKAGVDLVLSVDPTITPHLNREARETPVVLLPTRWREGYTPRSAREKVESISVNFEVLKSEGFKKIILDPILEPPINPGTLDSLIAYREVAKRYSENPILMGISNVVELIDSDSSGVIGLLMVLAGEVGVSLVLTVEHSCKTRGAIGEAYLASIQSSLSLYMNRQPKDLGVDTLIFKEKRDKSIRLDVREVSKVRVEGVDESFKRDPLGDFKIWINRSSETINALYEGVKGKILVEGESSESVGKKILELGLVSELSHALYLGRELEKAELALKMGKSYIQDFEFFKPLKSRVRDWRGRLECLK